MSKHGAVKEERSKEMKKKKKSNNTGIKVFICILILLGILGGLVLKRAYDLDWNWIALIMGHNKNTVENLDRLTVLVLGESGGNADTMMIVTYDPKTQEAGMLSIPRDTFTGTDPEKAKVSDRINAVYRTSPEKAVEAVNRITGLDIKYYVLVDTQIVADLVDIIGGIEYDVIMDMKYDDSSQDLHINLKKGRQMLTGDQVVQLTRFRHNNDGSTYPYDYGIEDYGRMRTQRSVIKLLAKKTIDIKNVTEIGNIIDTFSKNVKTNIDVQSVKDYIPYGISIDIDEIKSEQLPGADEQKNGSYFFFPDKEKTKLIVDEIFRGKQRQESDSQNANDID